MIRAGERSDCAAASPIGSRTASSMPAVIRHPALESRLRLMNDIPCPYCFALEVVTQRELNHARFGTNRGDHAEVWIVDVEIGILEVYGIEDVKEFSTEFDVLALSYACALERAEVSTEEAGTGKNGVRQAAQRAGRRVRKLGHQRRIDIVNAAIERAGAQCSAQFVEGDSS